MRPDFRGFLAWVLSAHDARGWRQVALQTKSEKYCSQASRASMHCNQGRLRTCFRVFTRPRPIPVIPGRRDAVDLAVQRGARQVLCRAWLGPRDPVNSRPSSWPQRRPDFLSVLGRVSKVFLSATKRPRSSATR